MKSAVETLSPTRAKLTVEVPFEELKPSLDGQLGPSRAQGLDGALHKCLLMLMVWGDVRTHRRREPGDRKPVESIDGAGTGRITPGESPAAATGEANGSGGRSGGGSIR